MESACASAYASAFQIPVRRPSAAIARSPRGGAGTVAFTVARAPDRLPGPTAASEQRRRRPCRDDVPLGSLERGAGDRCIFRRAGLLDRGRGDPPGLPAAPGRGPDFCSAPKHRATGFAVPQRREILRRGATWAALTGEDAPPEHAAGAGAMSDRRQACRAFPPGSAQHLGARRRARSVSISPPYREGQARRFLPSSGAGKLTADRLGSAARTGATPSRRPPRPGGKGARAAAAQRQAKTERFKDGQTVADDRCGPAGGLYRLRPIPSPPWAFSCRKYSTGVRGCETPASPPNRGTGVRINRAPQFPPAARLGALHLGRLVLTDVRPLPVPAGA